MNVRIMHDSITAADIPADAAMVAGYVDGIYAWSAADWARFPNAQHVGIAVSPATDAGQVLDVETGDAEPFQAPGWVLGRRAAGADPTVYVQLSRWFEVRRAFQAAGVFEPHYWIAAYGNPPMPSLFGGAVAHQYVNPAGGSGGHYDLSVVADHWPGVDGVYGPGGGTIGEIMDPRIIDLLSALFPVSADTSPARGKLAYLLNGPSAGVDTAAILAAIADLKAHPVAGSDPAVLAIVTRMESALKGA